MLSKHLLNPFLSLKVGDDNFDKFVKSHIERTRPLNVSGSPYMTLLNDSRTATESLYTQYNQSVSVKVLNKAQKEGKTLTVNEQIGNIKKFISRKEGVLKDKFPDGSSVYEELFPKGLKEYSTASKKNIGLLLKRFIDTLTSHQSEIDKSILDEAQALYDNLTQKRAAQLTKIGEVKDNRTGSGELRKQLSIQLFKNLLLLLLIHAECPEKVKDYFDESFIGKHVKKAVSENTAAKQ